MNPPFIDIHTHCQSLVETCSRSYFSYGIHPWWLHPDIDPGKDLERLESFLEEGRLAAIGETGIDRLYHDTLALQLETFEKHILLSEQYHKPLILHNVKATADLLRLHKKRQPLQPWIIHGFNGTEEEARQLTDRGIFLSVGESLLYPNRKIGKTILSIPWDYLFFDTDTSGHGIEAIYRKAAERLNVPLETLKEKIFVNFARLNLEPWKTGKTAHDCSSATMALINWERAMC